MLPLEPELLLLLLLHDVSAVLGAPQLDIDGVLVVHDPPNPRKWGVNQLFLRQQRPLLLVIGEGAGIRKELDVLNYEVSAPRDVDLVGVGGDGVRSGFIYMG